MSRDQTRISRIIRRFRERTIGVLGDFMLDELWRGEATRISPEAPVPVVLMGNSASVPGFPGGAGNVAANIRALGARPIPFGAIGADSTGQQLRRLLESCKIHSSTLVEERGRVTPRKIRIVAHQHQLLRLDFEEPAPVASRTAEAIFVGFKRSVGKLDALVVSDYGKGSVTAELCRRVVAEARRRRLPVFVDPKPQNSEICRHATAITPNLHEAELMAGAPVKNGRELEAVGRRLLAEFNCEYVLITRGSEGVTLFEAATAENPRGAAHEIPSVPRPVYDVTGAGDTVIAVLALAYAPGASMREAAELANLAAGRVVLKFGTAGVTTQELLQAAVERDDRPK